MAGTVGREPWLRRKARERSAQGQAQEHFPKSLSGKTRRAEYHEFLQQPEGLKGWSFRGRQAGTWPSPEGAALLLEQRRANDPGGRLRSEDRLSGTGRDGSSFRSASVRGGIASLGTKDPPGGAFPPPPLNIGAETPAEGG